MSRRLFSTIINLSSVRAGANEQLIQKYNFIKERWGTHYSDPQLVEGAVQICAIGRNNVYGMSTAQNATIENLEKCGLTRQGAEMFLRERKDKLDGSRRLYREVAAFLSQ